MKTILYRIYNDYFMGSRLDSLENSLKLVLTRGYQVVSVGKFHEFIKLGDMPDQKLLILRHDIDTDIATSKRIFDLEKRLGIYGSFYFRLSTIDIDFMRYVNNEGGEVGYHFEEIATVLKYVRIESREELLLKAKELFKKNISRIRIESALEIGGIASHGDFSNRACHIPNYEFIDLELRHRCNIQYEAYDHIFSENLVTRI